MDTFAFITHPTSLEDVVRYEPGAAGKGRPIVEKIVEWLPSYNAAHVTGIRSPGGREIAGWFVMAPLLPEQMLAFERERVYKKILDAIEIGAGLGAKIVGLGAFTGVVGDAGVTLAARSPIPVTTGNSLTVATGIRSLLRGAREMDVDPAGATAVVIGATGSIGSACVELLAPHVAHIVLVARNATRLRAHHDALRERVTCGLSWTTDVHEAVPQGRLVLTATTSTMELIEPGICKPAPLSANFRCRTTWPAGSAIAPTCWWWKAASCGCRALLISIGCASRVTISISACPPARRSPACPRPWYSPSSSASRTTHWAGASIWARCGRSTPWRNAADLKWRRCELSIARLRRKTSRPNGRQLPYGPRPRRRHEARRFRFTGILVARSPGGGAAAGRAVQHRAGRRMAVAGSAIAKVKELDGTVDAIGLGGIDVYLYAGTQRYGLRDGLRLLAAARRTPVVDGSGLKNTLEREAVRFVSEELKVPLRGTKVLMVSALDRFGMAQALVEAGADVLFGDFIFALDHDKPVRDLAEFEALARNISRTPATAVSIFLSDRDETRSGAAAEIPSIL